ncbi:hypothetical protein [Methylobacterium trifolii]|uniref:Uncharacterized protein n=1 Tax=Methylobacterium trifolii TaxID=1003092 RepID=A0ABQ4U2I3_9HYPH|nr:hypothetical protein [Methylobacterium trifolii]GJE61188.1 hypothetical protein MPOCJGCO_3309 [Methylobacterium trifolii]
MNPLKAAIAVAACALLFWLALRVTRRFVDIGIAAGHAEERRRLEAEAAEEARAAQAARDGAVP